MLNNACQPVLGFATKREAILALHGRGIGVDVIADRVGSTRDSVKTVLSRSRRKTNAQSTDGDGQVPQLLELPTGLIVALRRHAARRDLTSRALALTILETVLRDDMVEAVLDDREI